MRGVSFGLGVVSATCAIGPLVVLAIVAYDLATDPPADTGMMMAVPVALFVGLLVGGFVSVIPNVVGAALLGWLGCHERWARHPLLWLATGIVLGGAIGIVVGDGEQHLPLVFAAAGGVSALICRRGTDWDD